MAEMVSSVLVQEAVNQVISSVKDKYEEQSSAKEHIERMEMAHVKLEAALETSDRWNVTSGPLLRWQSKLKRAAEECDDTLRRCRQCLQEGEEGQMMEQPGDIRSSSFPRRIARSAKSFLSSIFRRSSSSEPSGSAVRRFERFADGASEFLRYVEVGGGTPRQYLFFDPLVRHLLADKGTEYSVARGDGQRFTFFLRPFATPEHGVEGRMIFLLEDGEAPQNNFVLALTLRISESTDIVGITVRCLQLFAPHMRSTAETAKAKLTQLPTQDLHWAPYVDSSPCRKEHWNNLHEIICKWFRPNPLCCQQHGRHHRYMQSYDTGGSSSSTCSPSDVYLEPVTEVYMQGNVPLSAGRSGQRPVVVDGMTLDGNGETCSTGDLPYLRLGGLFSPHAFSDDLSPAVGGSATEMVDGEAAQRGSYANISFEQLGEVMLPRAVGCILRGDAGGATSYQMLWRSRHGGAYLRADKTAWGAAAREECRGGNRRRRRGKKAPRWTTGMIDFIGSWVPHAPAELQGSIVDWVQKERQMQLGN